MSEAMFDSLDVNHDGVLSREEQVNGHECAEDSRLEQDKTGAPCLDGDSEPVQAEVMEQQDGEVEVADAGKEEKASSPGKLTEERLAPFLGRKSGEEDHSKAAGEQSEEAEKRAEENEQQDSGELDKKEEAEENVQQLPVNSQQLELIEVPIPVQKHVDVVVVETVEKVVDVPVVKQVEVPQVQTIEKIVEVPLVQTVEKVVDVPMVGQTMQGAQRQVNVPLEVQRQEHPAQVVEQFTFGAPHPAEVQRMQVPQQPQYNLSSSVVASMPPSSPPIVDFELWAQEALENIRKDKGEDLKRFARRVEEKLETKVDKAQYEQEKGDIIRRLSVLEEAKATSSSSMDQQSAGNYPQQPAAEASRVPANPASANATSSAGNYPQQQQQPAAGAEAEAKKKAEEAAKANESAGEGTEVKKEEGAEEAKKDRKEEERERQLLAAQAKDNPQEAASPSVSPQPPPEPVQVDQTGQPEPLQQQLQGAADADGLAAAQQGSGSITEPAAPKDTETAEMVLHSSTRTENSASVEWILLKDHGWVCGADQVAKVLLKRIQSSAFSQQRQQPAAQPQMQVVHAAGQQANQTAATSSGAGQPPGYGSQQQGYPPQDENFGIRVFADKVVHAAGQQANQTAAATASGAVQPPGYGSQQQGYPPQVPKYETVEVIKQVAVTSKDSIKIVPRHGAAKENIASNASSATNQSGTLHHQAHLAKGGARAQSEDIRDLRPEARQQQQSKPEALTNLGGRSRQVTGDRPHEVSQTPAVNRRISPSPAGAQAYEGVESGKSADPAASLRRQPDRPFRVPRSGARSPVQFKSNSCAATGAPSHLSAMMGAPRGVPVGLNSQRPGARNPSAISPDPVQFKSNSCAATGAPSHLSAMMGAPRGVPVGLNSQRPGQQSGAVPPGVTMGQQQRASSRQALPDPRRFHPAGR